MPSTADRDRESLIAYLEKLNTVLHQNVQQLLPQEIARQYADILPEMDGIIVKASEILKTDQHDGRLRKCGLLGPQLHLKLAILEKLFSSLKEITRTKLEKLLHLSSVIFSSLFEALKDALEDALENNPWLEALSELLEFLSWAISNNATKHRTR